MAPVLESGGVGRVDERPVVKPRHVRTVSGRRRFPGAHRDQFRQGVDPAAPDGRGDLQIAADPEDEADLVFFQPVPQLRVRAVDLVAGDPAQPAAGQPEAADHVEGQHGLRREPGPAWYTGCYTPFPVVRPGLWKV